MKGDNRIKKCEIKGTLGCLLLCFLKYKRKKINNMYENYYNRNFIPITPTRQNNINMINDEIARLENMKNQLTQQSQQQNTPAINQTFQLAPTTSSNMKFVNKMEDVIKETVFFDTPFFSKDLSVMWVKNPKGDIKSYELTEIIEKDEKDLQIEYLNARLEELERKYENEQHTTNVIPTEVTTDTSRDGEPIGEPVEKVKSAGVSRISKSKTK